MDAGAGTPQAACRAVPVAGAPCHRLQDDAIAGARARPGTLTQIGQFWPGNVSQLQSVCEW
jgi:hypothetical protein